MGEFQLGLLVGLLIGEGHFGGDGRQAQVTLRMHTRHQPLFDWLKGLHPESKLLGLTQLPSSSLLGYPFLQNI